MKSLTSQERLLLAIELIQGNITTKDICYKYGISIETFSEVKKFLIENIGLVFNHEEIVSELHSEIETKNKEIEELNAKINERDLTVAKFCTNKMIDYDILLKSYGH